MTDTFLVLMLARTGDSLQGIKKGVLEIADVIAVNKADGEFVRQAHSAAGELATALQLLYPADAPWVPPVLTCSGLTGTGLPELWSAIEHHRDEAQASGRFESRRAQQRIGWMWATVEHRLVSKFKHRPDVRELVGDLEARLRDGTLTPARAARYLLDLR
jgi:LAO/AO transport system kinase